MTAPDHRRVLLAALSILLLLVAFLVAWPFRTSIVFAAVLGYVLHPLHRRLTGVVRRAWISAGALLLLVTAAIVAPVALVAWSLRDQAAEAVRVVEAQGLRGAVADALARLGVPSAAVDDVVRRIISTARDYVAAQAAGAVTAFSHIIAAVIVFYVLLYYFLVDGQRLVAFIRDALPSNADGLDLLDTTGDRVRALVLGTLVIAVVQGVVAGVGWWILGLPTPIFWGVVMTVLSIIPLVGAFLVLLPAAIWQLAEGAYLTAAGLLVLNFIAVGLIDDVLRPVVVGRFSSELHAGIVLVGILGGIAAFGVSGLVLGPILLSLLAPVFIAWARASRHAER